MNYLQLCQRVALECGVTNSDSIPAAVTGQTGDLLRIVKWVASAYTELQTSKTTWQWLQARFSFNTVDGTSEYAYGLVTDVAASAYITRLAAWLLMDPRNPPKAYLTSGGVAGQYILRPMSWEDFQSTYELGTEQEGPPSRIAISPDKKIHLGPTPNGIYTVTGNYQKSAQVLSDGADIPELPSDFHMVIMYDAMLKYGNAESALEIINRQQTEGQALRSQLRLDQLPKFRGSDPLA